MVTTFKTIMLNGGIKIPKIQREYAQGRLDERSEAIRKNFIKHLLNTIKENKSISLDFVYGIKDATNLLLPLDGQQRLTTLFLLHWYCGVDMGEWVFDYESRREVQCFVKGLIEHCRKSPRDKKPIEEIEASDWYKPIWRSNPSVSGMLEMLIEIHKQFKGMQIDDLNLEELEKRLEKITFSINDELNGDYGNIFLKMNARGLPLNDWENLKNILDKYSQKSWKEAINNDWPEFLWGKIPKSTLEEQIQSLDLAMEKVVRIAMWQHIGDYNFSIYDINEENIKDVLITTFKWFEMLTEAKAYDNIAKSWTIDRNKNLLWNREENDNEGFNNWLFNANPSMKDMCRFIFLLEFYKEGNRNNRRARQVLNLLDNSDVNSINKGDILEEGLKILKNGLALTGFNETSFNKRQYQDECLKANFAVGDIIDLECNDFVYCGSLSFLHSGDESEIKLEKLKERLGKISNSIKDDWKSLYVYILSTQRYPNENKDIIPAYTIIPKKDEKDWAEGVFSNSKEALQKGLSKFYEEENIPENDKPAWIKHLKKLLENDKLGEFCAIKNTAGWNYCVKKINLTDESIRLAWNDIEYKKLEKIGWDDPITYEDQKNAIKKKDGKELKINDPSWWEKE